MYTLQTTAPNPFQIVTEWLAGLRQPEKSVQPTRRALASGVTTWVRAPQGRVVTCERGTLWLTFDGEPEDIVLEAGQSHRCTKSSPLAIHGLSAAAVTVA